METAPIDVLSTAKIYTKLIKAGGYNGGEWHGPCPFCGGQDRFHVWPRKGRWWCRQCQASGDAIALVMRAEGLTFRDACHRLRIAPPRRSPTPQSPCQPRPHVPDMRRDYAAFTDDWQDAAARFIAASADYLWNDDRALAYLRHERRLADATIRLAELGFNPHTRRERWGQVDVWLPRGIVIPWVIDWHCWRVRFRCLDQDYRQFTPRRASGDPVKYPQVRGSANGLYTAGLSAAIHRDSTILMVEGEFDALTIHSNAARLLPLGLRAVATGGTTQARVTRWVTALSVAKRVWLAFDAGESSGPLAAVWWQAVLPNAARLRPTAHDVTDMVRAGHDLMHWIPMPIEATQPGLLV